MTRHLAIMLAMLVAATLEWSVVSEAQAYPRARKVIASGWDTPTPQQFRRDLSTMEKLCLDGGVVEVKAFGQPDDITSCPLREAFSGRPWESGWFEQSIADLGAVRSSKLTDNFISLQANPGNVDWFDDAGWAQIALDRWAASTPPPRSEPLHSSQRESPSRRPGGKNATIPAFLAARPGPP